MKNLKNLLLSFFTLAFISCSSDNDTTNIDLETDVNISHFIYKAISPDNSSFSSTTYQLENNRIVSATSDQSQETSEYQYNNDKISSISNYNSGVLQSKRFYVYENDNLVEYRIENYNPTEIYKVTKHNFTHTNDTIYLETTRTQDGANYESYFTGKMKLISNGRTYFEQTYGNETDIVTMVYEANNNPATEIRNEANGILTTNQMTYDSTLSSYAMIMKSTYSRKTLLMLYHLQSTAINNINPKILAKNNITGFQSSWGDGNISFEIINDINANNFNNKTIYNCYSNNELISKFQYEFYFD
jgi:hypothetical protein